MEIRVDGDWIMADGYFVAKLDSKAPASVLDAFKKRFEGVDEESEEFQEALDEAVNIWLDKNLANLMSAIQGNVAETITTQFEEFGA